jgi:enamine deaminase RidA (YjgF/YER057c/UK114 family)
LIRDTAARHPEHDQVVARRVDHPTHTEWYITARPTAHTGDAREPSSAGWQEAASDLFNAVAGVLAANQISVLRERIFGRSRARQEVLERRATALSRVGIEADWPVTAVEGQPASGSELGGVQIWGVTPRAGGGARIETVEWQGRKVGREWIGPGFRQLVLSSIEGDANAGGDAAPEQARLMFEAASAVLAARGYGFRHVARTWIYLADIVDWYGEFNRVRNAHYARAGLSPAGEAVFPASTGIEGRHVREACLMDLLAVDAQPASGLVVRPVLRSERQGEASAYGSAFARAMVFERGGRKIIEVSGTASIDADGRSAHPGDASAQYCGTLLSIAALLEQEGASLSAIAQGTLFAKTAAVARACQDVSRRLSLPGLPLIEVVADVCRPELLVEVEAVAIV